MMTDIISGTTSHTYSYDGREIRVTLEKDEPMFVAKDVCDALDHTNHRMAVQGLDEDEVSTAYVTDSIGRKQETIVITESGLYALIFQSRKPEAKRFRKWVTSEVLPAIRRRGSYALSDRRTLDRAQQLRLRAEAQDLRARAQHLEALARGTTTRRRFDVVPRPAGWLTLMEFLDLHQVYGRERAGLCSRLGLALRDTRERADWVYGTRRPEGAALKTYRRKVLDEAWTQLQTLRG